MKKSNRLKSKNNFFAYIDLFIVIAVLIVLVFVTVLGMNKFFSNYRKEAYVTMAKSIMDDVRKKVDDGDVSTYDIDTTYYIPASYITNDYDTTPLYDDLSEAYVAVTYDEDGFNYYWTSCDKNKLGIYLTYYDKLSIENINSNIASVGTDVGVCGKKRIVVYDHYGETIEIKDADFDCVKPKDSYELEELKVCDNKLFTQFGSFSSETNEKESCISLVDNYSYKYEYTDNLLGANSKDLNAILIVNLDKSYFGLNSYVRVYSDKEMKKLVGEVTLNDYPKYSTVIKNPLYKMDRRVLKTLNSNVETNYYIDMSADIRKVVGDSDAISIMYGTTITKLENGPWIKKAKDISKISYLVESLDNIKLSNVCSNSNPHGGVIFEGFEEVGKNYVANIKVYCDGVPNQ